jgi:hypothetical protein
MINPLMLYPALMVEIPSSQRISGGWRRQRKHHNLVLHKKPPFIVVRPLDVAQSSHLLDCSLEHIYIPIDHPLAEGYLRTSHVYKAFFVFHIYRAQPNITVALTTESQLAGKCPQPHLHQELMLNRCPGLKSRKNITAVDCLM